MYDVKEIIRRLSGKKFSDEDLTKIAEAVCFILLKKFYFYFLYDFKVINEVDLRDDKKITAEIFEYFLSNVPDFPS